MAKIAIIKPDHLGDMVLASPAIKAMMAHYENVTIFPSPWAFPLARALYPKASFKTLELSHLAKTPVLDPVRAEDFARELSAYDLAVFLRHDPFLEKAFNLVDIPAVSCGDDGSLHESQKHHQAVSKIVGDYSVETFFPYRRKSRQWPDKIKSVGLCVSAGFTTNKLPNFFWIELARKLQKKGLAITMIGGPAETRDLDYIAGQLQPEPFKLIGSSRFEDLWSAVEQLDLVIGSDSGSLHLCSLAAPILGLYTSSAWWNYAPVGSWNRVYSLNLPCAPCAQFSKWQVNTCVTRECSDIDPAAIAELVGRPL